jgi:hypothetical protein
MSDLLVNPVSSPPQSVAKRPGRPLGLSLAILATSCLFSVMPLFQLVLDLLVSEHLNRVINEWTMPFGEDGGEVEPVFAGVEAQFLGDGQSVALAALGLGFLGVAWIAWRGRPRWGRLIFFGAVLTLDVIYGWLLIQAILAPVDPSQGFDSSQEIVRSSYVVYLVSVIVITVYLLWYMNRAPARAFYRGYYLSETKQSENQAEQQLST